MFCCFLNEPTCWLLPEIPLKRHKHLHSAVINKKLKLQRPRNFNTEIQISSTQVKMIIEYSFLLIVRWKIEIKITCINRL